MRATALIPLIFLAITYPAQAGKPSYQKYPTTPPETHFQGTCDSDPDGTKFAEKACYTRFRNPGDSGVAPHYRPPTCDKKSKPLTQEQKAILAKAYSRAPDYMKGKLCRLTQVFVNSISMVGPHGLGFLGGTRSAARQQERLRRHFRSATDRQEIVCGRREPNHQRSLAG